MLRAVEFRGKTKEFADKTTFIRRFGVPAFTLYAFHRYLGQIAVSFMAWISGNDYYLESKNLPFGYTLINIAVAISFISLIIWLWEKIGYIGSLEWFMGLVITAAFPRIPKSKSAASDVPKDKGGKLSIKQIIGPINIQKAFYEPEWEIDFAEMNMKKSITGNLRLNLWFSLFGIIFLPLAISSFVYMIRCDPESFDSENEKLAKIVKVISIICLVLSIALWTSLSFLNLSTIGVSF